MRADDGRPTSLADTVNDLGSTVLGAAAGTAHTAVSVAGRAASVTMQAAHTVLDSELLGGESAAFLSDAANDGDDPALWAKSSDAKPRRPAVANDILTDFERRIAQQNSYDRKRDRAIVSWPPWRKRLNVFVRTDPSFEAVMFCLIFLNCVSISLFNWSKDEAFNDALSGIDDAFTVVFFLEMCVKMLGRGFLISPGGYFRTKVNLFDFAIVVVTTYGLLQKHAFPSVERDAGWTVQLATIGRLMRPIRALNAVDSLRSLFQALLVSFRRLADAGLLALAVGLFMGVIAMAAFGPALQYRCITNELAIDANTSVPIRFPVPAGVNESLVSEVTWEPPGLAVVCRYGMPPGTELDAPMPLLPPTVSDGRVCPFAEYCLRRETPERGFVNFEFALTTFSTLFSVASLEAWTDVMMYVMEARGNAAAFYFIVLVLVGTIFVVNLVLAILTDGFTRSFEAIQVAAERRRARLDAEGSGGIAGIAAIAADMTAHAMDAAQQQPLLGAVSNALGGSRSENEQQPNAGRRSRSVSFVNGADPNASFTSSALSRVLGKERAQDVRGRAESCMSVVNAKCAAITRSRPFTYTTVVVALVNTVTTAIDESVADDPTLDALWWVHIGCVGYFNFEIALRLLSEPLLEFFRNPGNSLDFLVSVNAMVEMLVARHSSIGVFRSLNLLQLHPALRRTVTILSSSLRSTVSNVALLVIATFLFALLGMLLFANSMCGLDKTSPYRVDTIECDNVPRGNFDNIAYAAVTVFVIFVGNGWREIMTNTMAARSKFAAYYFIVALLVGLYLILSLFVAVLINTVQSNGGLIEHGAIADSDSDSEGEFDDASPPPGPVGRGILGGQGGGGEDEGVEMETQPGSTDAASPSPTRTVGYAPPLAMSASEQEAVDGTAEPSGRDSPTSRRLLMSPSEGRQGVAFDGGDDAPANPHSDGSFKGRALRVWRQRSYYAGVVVKSRLFYLSVITAIALSMVSLSLETPLANPYDPRLEFSRIIEILTAVLFVVEAGLKLIFMGVHQKGLKRSATRFEGGYFNHAWNVFDFVLMTIAVVSVIAGAIDPRVGEALGATRALRPFSLIGRYQSLRVVFKTLANSVKALGNVACVACLIWLLFAICGTRLFSGLMNACTTGPIWGDASYGPLDLRFQSECEAAGHRWAPFPKNFDNVLESMVTLFGVITKDNWKQVLFMTSSADAFDHAPSANSRPFMVLFGACFTLVMTFFVINVFLSVLVDSMFRTKAKEHAKYLRRKKKKDNRIESLLGDLNERQTDYVDLYRRAVFYVKPPAPAPFARTSIRRYFRSVIRSHRFEWLLFALIVLSVFVQLFPDGDPASNTTYGLYVVDLVFSTAFMLASLAQPVAFGIRGMVEHPFELGMTGVNMACLVGAVLALNTHGQPLPATVVGLVTLRIVRLARVTWLTTGVRRIVVTFRSSARSFLGLGFILFLVFYLYAVVGMALFGRVKWGIGLNAYANFTSTPLALLTLFRCATFDNWQVLMWDCSVKAPLCDPSIGECGNLVFARIYFMSFIVASNWIGINCFTAVLLESFAQSEREERFAVREPHVRQFMRLWKCEALREVTMPAESLVEFLSALPPPLGPFHPDWGDKPKGDESGSDDESDGDGDKKKKRSSDGSSTDGNAYHAMDSAGQSPTASAAGFDEVETGLEERKRDAVLDVLKELGLVAVDGHVTQQEVFDALLRYYYGVPLNPSIRGMLDRACRQAFRSKQRAAAAAAAASAGMSPSASPSSAAFGRGASPSGASPRSNASPVSQARLGLNVAPGESALPALKERMPVRILVMIMKMQIAFRRRRMRRRRAARLLPSGDDMPGYEGEGAMSTPPLTSAASVGNGSITGLAGSHESQ